MNVLFFCPTMEKETSQQLLGILQRVNPEANHPTIEVLDEKSTFRSADAKQFDAVVIVYTPEVELSKSLFEIIRCIDRDKPPGRFIFLPRSDGKAIIPAIFHPIRALQLRLFYYSTLNDLGTQIPAFEHSWSLFVNPVAVGQSDKKGRQAGFGLIVFVSSLILILVGLIAEILPIIPPIVSKPTPTPIHPPTALAFWLQQSFQNIDTSTVWHEQHYYTGKQALQSAYSNHGLRLSAYPVVTNAVYQLDSVQNWPLDDLQSLSFAFKLSALDDPLAKDALVVSLVLDEDNSYRLDCPVFTTGTGWKIQCQIQGPSQAEAVSEAVPVSVETDHSASLVFDPLNYTVQFFLDDRYYGKGLIKAVPYWRARNFKLQVRNELQNLNSGSFSSELESLDLAHSH